MSHLRASFVFIAHGLAAGLAAAYIGPDVFGELFAGLGAAFLALSTYHVALAFLGE